MKPIDTINPRIQYYLLDFKDKHISEFRKMFPDKGLNDLSHAEINTYFTHATDADRHKLSPKNEICECEEKYINTQKSLLVCAKCGGQ